MYKRLYILFILVLCFQSLKANNDAAWGLAIYLFWSIKLVALLIVLLYLFLYFLRDSFSKKFLCILPLPLPFVQFLYNYYTLDSDFSDTIELLRGINIFLLFYSI